MNKAADTSRSEGLSTEDFSLAAKKGLGKLNHHFCKGWVENCHLSLLFWILFELWMKLCNFWG